MATQCKKSTTINALQLWNIVTDDSFIMLEFLALIKNRFFLQTWGIFQVYRKVRFVLFPTPVTRVKYSQIFPALLLYEWELMGLQIWEFPK